MASEYVYKHLCKLANDIFEEPTYSKNGKLIKHGRKIWDKTIKNWNTIYAICIDKIYDYSNILKGYILQDFSGNTIEVKSSELKIAIALNKIDVVNLSLCANDSELGRLVQINKYDVVSFEHLEEIVRQRGNCEHYVVGNIKMGYFELIGKTTVIDYKGYCTEIILPSVDYMSECLLSFNDYVKKVSIPNTYKILELIGYGSKALSNIHMDFDNKHMLDIKIRRAYRVFNEYYTELNIREDVYIHVCHFNMNALEFFKMMEQRHDLMTRLKIGNSNIDDKDPLQKFILKHEMLGLNKFEIDFPKRALSRYNSSDNVDTLKLPPVESLRFGWYIGCGHIGTLYMPENLKERRLSLSTIPHKADNIYDGKKGEYTIIYTKSVDKVVVPKESLVEFVSDDVAKLGIIFETKYGTGKATDIAVKTPNTGIKLKVIDLITHPDVRLKDTTIKGHISVIIEDSNGNRKSVLQNVLIDKVLCGDVQLINADILFNKTIKIK